MINKEWVTTYIIWAADWPRVRVGIARLPVEQTVHALALWVICRQINQRPRGNDRLVSYMQVLQHLCCSQLHFLEQ